MNAAATEGDESRMSRDDGDPRRAEVRHEGPADQARRLFVDLRRVQPADVVGLEDRWVDAHSRL
jgi:hypothetical protein